MLEVSALAKSYAEPVLRAIELSVPEGQIHGLVGSNGAGKSTLCKIIAGLVSPDAGSVSVGRQSMARFTRAESRALGVQFVRQELNQIATLTVAENMLLHAIPNRLGFVDRAALTQRAERALAMVGLADLATDIPISALGIGTRQLVEIAAAFVEDCAVLILDEPTAALNKEESDFLFAQLKRLSAQGVAIVYVSHKLQEVLDLCDEVSVLRDGALIATVAASDLDDRQLVEYMTGVEHADSRFTSHRSTQTLLEVRDLSSPVWQSISFQLNKGERLGIAGLVGAGRTELLRLIFGADAADRGQLTIDGKDRQYIQDAVDARRSGLALLPEDRQADGLLLDQSVVMNAALIRQNSGVWLDRAAEDAEVTSRLTELQTQYYSLDQRVSELSGGNQQKVVLAKWLATAPKILLLDEPTRGVDVKARTRIHAELEALASLGCGLIIVSSELSELFSTCDRILTICDFQITGEFARDSWSEGQILHAMFGASAA